MKKQKLNYRFHNPNTAEVTADYILKVFIEANCKCQALFYIVR